MSDNEFRNSDAYRETAAYQFDKLHDALFALFMAICEPWATPILDYLERTLDKVYRWFDER